MPLNLLAFQPRRRDDPHHGLDLRDQQAHRTLRNLAAVVRGETPDADDHYGRLLHELRSALEDICALVDHLEHNFLTCRDTILAIPAGDNPQGRSYWTPVTSG